MVRCLLRLYFFQSSLVPCACSCVTLGNVFIDLSDKLYFKLTRKKRIVVPCLISDNMPPKRKKTSENAGIDTTSGGESPTNDKKKPPRKRAHVSGSDLTEVIRRINRMPTKELSLVLWNNVLGRVSGKNRASLCSLLFTKTRATDLHVLVISTNHSQYGPTFTMLLKDLLFYHPKWVPKIEWKLNKVGLFSTLDKVRKRTKLQIPCASGFRLRYSTDRKEIEKFSKEVCF